MRNVRWCTNRLKQAFVSLRITGLPGSGNFYRFPGRVCHRSCRHLRSLNQSTDTPRTVSVPVAPVPPPSPPGPPELPVPHEVELRMPEVRRAERVPVTVKRSTLLRLPTQELGRYKWYASVLKENAREGASLLTPWETDHFTGSQSQISQ